MLQNSIMDTFLVIVSLIATVLNIILFFKVWGMTDDVGKINKKLSNNGKLTYQQLKSELGKYIIKKDKDGARVFLTECLLAQLTSIPLNTDRIYAYNNIVKRYTNLFALIGEKELPYGISDLKSGEFFDILEAGLTE